MAAPAWLADLIRADAARPTPMPGPAEPPPAFRRPRRADLADLAARVRAAGTHPAPLAELGARITVPRHLVDGPAPADPAADLAGAFRAAARADLADLARTFTLPTDLRPAARWQGPADGARAYLAGMPVHLDPTLPPDTFRLAATGPQAGQDGPGRADGPTVPGQADHGPHDGPAGPCHGCRNGCPLIGGPCCPSPGCDPQRVGEDTPPCPTHDAPQDAAPLVDRADLPDPGPGRPWCPITGRGCTCHGTGPCPRVTAPPLAGILAGPDLAEPLPAEHDRARDELARVAARIRAQDRLAGCRCPGRHLPDCPARADVDAPQAAPQAAPGCPPGDGPCPLTPRECARRHPADAPPELLADTPPTSTDAAPVADHRLIPDGPPEPCTCTPQASPAARAHRPPCPHAHTVHAPTRADGARGCRACPFVAGCTRPACAARHQDGPTTGPRWCHVDGTPCAPACDTGEAPPCGPTGPAERQADHDEATRRARACTCLTRAPDGPPCPIGAPTRQDGPQDGPTAPDAPQEAAPVPDHDDDVATCRACGNGPQDDPASGPRTRQDDGPRPETPDTGRQDGTPQDEPTPCPTYGTPCPADCPDRAGHCAPGRPAGTAPAVAPQDGPRLCRGVPCPWSPCPHAARCQETAQETRQDGPADAPRWMTADGRTWTAPAGTPWPDDPRDTPPEPWRQEDGPDRRLCPPCRRADHAACIGAGRPAALSTRACPCPEHAPQDGPDRVAPHPCPTANGAPCTLRPGALGCCQEAPREATRGPVLTVSGPGRLYVAPIGTPLPHEAPDPCPMAPYEPPGPDDAALGNPWREIGTATPATLTFGPLAEQDDPVLGPVGPLSALRAAHISLDLSGAFRDMARILGVDLAAQERARQAERAEWRRGHMRDLRTRARYRAAGRPLPAELVTR